MPANKTRGDVRQADKPQFLRSLAAALRAAADTLERDASMGEAITPGRPSSDSAPVETDWIQDVVAKLPPLMTVSETAKALRMSARNVSRNVARGRLVTVRTGVGGGSRVLIARAEVARFLRRLDVEP
jgi:excisionase family DNA binding protein